MLQFIIRRLLLSIPVVIATVVLVFMLIHLAPGDPVDVLLGDQATQMDKQALMSNLGLDLPILTQLKNYSFGLLKLDLGKSIFSNKPVFDLILERVPATLELALASLLIAIFFGILLGVFAAIKQNSLWDVSTLVVGLIGLSLPAILLGPLLIYLFSIKLSWFPVSERGTLLHLVLPAVTLASGLVAIILRMTRTSMLDVIRQEYITVAKAKGLKPKVIYFKHALVNAITPVLTVIGLITGALLSGVTVVEIIFDWPGIGTLLLDSINQRDYPIIQGCVLVIAVIKIVINLATDLLYAVFNPKIRLEY